MRPRHAGLDALRALALLPVIVVNWASYATPMNAALMLAPRPADSIPAQLLAALGSGLLEAKGVTLLTFLFGYGLVLGSRQASRVRRLLGLGLAHGLLLYFGDILTAYALAGLMALSHRRESLKRLRRRALSWLLMGLGLGVAIVSLSAGASDESLVVAPHAADGLLGWWQANALMYVAAWLMLLIVLPWTYALALLGMLAARLRWLTHRRWQAQRARLARAALPLLLLNLGYGAWLVLTQPAAATALSALMALLTLPAWVAWLLQRQLPAWLAAAGQQTLSVYLLSSLLLVLLWSPAGLGWSPGSAAVVLLAVLSWWLLMQGAAWLTRQGRRGPLEAWMARRSA